VSVILWFWGYLPHVVKRICPSRSTEEPEEVRLKRKAEQEEEQEVWKKKKAEQEEEHDVRNKKKAERKRLCVKEMRDQILAVTGCTRRCYQLNNSR
jgi:hypothetical protein